VGKEGDVLVDGGLGEKGSLFQMRERKKKFQCSTGKDDRGNRRYRGWKGGKGEKSAL